LSAEVARLFHQQQLSHCPGAKCITYDNWSDFKFHFGLLCGSFEITKEPTTAKESHATAILEYVMVPRATRCAKVVLICLQHFIVNSVWTFCSMVHAVLISTYCAALFGRKILVDIPYTDVWNDRGCFRQYKVTSLCVIKSMGQNLKQIKWKTRRIN
jgi:hypothetical protein